MPDSIITKNALAAAVKELMQQKPFAKISVGDICEQCGMSRKSFYYHFRDKYDLVNWIFYSDFLRSLQEEPCENGWLLMRNLCRLFYKDRHFYANALQVRGQNSFRDYFVEVLEPFIVAFTQDMVADRTHQKFFITFYCDAFLTAIVRWLSEGAEIPPDEFVDLFESVAEHFVSHLPKNEAPDA